MLPLLPLPKLQQYLPHLNDAMRAFEINTLLRTAAFIAQISHESAQFTRMLESLNYTKAAGLMATWPKRFPTEASALPFVRNEEKLANFVYANRMGNGDSASGDGFRYRGRGVIQLTGRDGYRRAGEALGLDLVGRPELAQAPEVAFQVAGLYWKSNGLNALADVPDLGAITQRINGGQVGQAERMKNFDLARRVLAVGFVADAAPTRGARRAPGVRVLPPDFAPLSRGWQDSPELDASAAGAPAARKSSTTKPPARKTAAKKTVIAPKAPAKRVSAKKAPEKKTAAKKAPTKKASVTQPKVKRGVKAPARNA
jgi:putative chitinase